eukprot:NODE_4128_length_1224_cov_37.990009_g3632_i0.p1 GENE.NODE_4128_length_1224_cov_37.990009_g3632_i0~~NODE_4128_length_1224_cov_37.990009_g3632_i0.p1  ORF type:complete len:295 (+),score=34.90 NODE_4128_length_1224_cov_37.990009_g3632_i0:103-987(+)
MAEGKAAPELITTNEMAPDPSRGVDPSAPHAVYVQPYSDAPPAYPGPYPQQQDGYYPQPQPLQPGYYPQGQQPYYPPQGYQQPPPGYQPPDYQTAGYPPGYQPPYDPNQAYMNPQQVYPQPNAVQAVPYNQQPIYGQPLAFNNMRPSFINENNNNCLAGAVLLLGFFCPCIWCAGFLFVTKNNKSLARILGSISLCMCCISILVVIIAVAISANGGQCGNNSTKKDCWAKSNCGWCSRNDKCTRSSDCKSPYTWTSNNQDHCLQMGNRGLCSNNFDVCKCCINCLNCKPTSTIC